MAWSKVERVMELSRLAGITVREDEAGEVADRLFSLLGELEQLATLDLAAVQPVTLFPEENDGDA
jgi:Asp-tRNA(Asn)/Glu-tRNA(Gln) amidotransferase C subunit